MIIFVLVVIQSDPDNDEETDEDNVEGVSGDEEVDGVGDEEQVEEEKDAAREPESRLPKYSEHKEK